MILKLNYKANNIPTTSILSATVNLLEVKVCCCLLLLVNSAYKYERWCCVRNSYTE